MSELGTVENPLRVAIVGSGPAGFYAADHLMKREGVEVDMFDRLPTPYGLVRGGVAPDHPKIKSVIRVYEKTAAKPGYRFFGNVDIGRDISERDLADRYHVVVYAYGAETDRHLGIPGEDLPGSHPATAFVGWYNAHPDYAGLEFDLSHERAVVIGNGNVAMDVARMLALTPDELRETDTADHAIEALAASQVREIVVLGRRGPAQAAFTNPEIKELGEMVDADCIVTPEEVELDPQSAAELASDAADKTHRVNVEILREFASRSPQGKSKRIVLQFLRSPLEIQGDGRVERVIVGRNRLEAGQHGRIAPVDTGERETIEAGLVLRSVGYKGIGLGSVPFDDQRGVIQNSDGRISGPTGNHLRGQYAVGWIKRGPSGVIGTNKKDAQETVDNIFEDVDAGHVHTPQTSDPGAIVALLEERGIDYVSFAGWKAIDAAEVGRGEPQGRPRVKFTSIDEMLEAAGAASADAVAG
ncbi:MAG: ferredoxin/flavodoxin---NADP+ reductase [Solirubrobacterales bacterium]|jgi:ferredoxin--NADP+ reductase|nr:ferredoxin/flavodoxin---NADP+ reductase [Solirubrobacterales bacterium]